MAALPLEVADIFNDHGRAYRQANAESLSRTQRRVMSAIELCRTAALGGHLERCDNCGHERNAFNSCRNRHCPKCQSLARARWLEAREAELLECEYFHVVFTMPQELAAIAFQNKRLVYDILFRCVTETLISIAADPKHLGAQIGFLTILHTWGQNLMHHPHLHCVVPGGGLSADGTRWIACRTGFFLPVRVLSRLFRRLFLARLRTAYEEGSLHFYGALTDIADPQAFARYLAPLARAEWVVYAKHPFGGPKQVLNYLGRYTHRVAISNHRLVSNEGGKVRFRWRDYRDESASKIMTLAGGEFIRRFLLHTLPPGFQRIRHCGLLGNRYRKSNLVRCREFLGQTQEPAPTTDPSIDYRDRYERLTGHSLRECPSCHCDQMVTLYVMPPRSVPAILDSS